MQSEDRPIHFSTELIHPPLQHKVATLQKLYIELAQVRTAFTGQGAYDSSDFSVPGQPKFHSRRGPKTQSIVVFLPDRLVLVEEWVDITFTEFLERVEEVAKRAMDTLAIPVFLAQTATVRTTFALTHFDDARVFLLDHACEQQGRIAPHFARPVAVGGLRFVLPATPEHAGDLHVTIESYRHSRNEVFVEVKGVFARGQIPRDALDAVCHNIDLVRSFITDSIFPYLNQYDIAITGPHDQPKQEFA